MTLNQLRYFCTAARCHSITQAAKLLFVTQPAISIAIRDLEKEFSLTLFAYTKNRLELTAEGEAFFERASELIRMSDDMKYQFSESQRYRPTIRLGIPPMISTVYFPELMDAFHEQYPDIYLELYEYSSMRACDMVQDEQLDIGLVNMELYNIDKFSNLVLSEERLVFCVDPSHRMADRERISIEQLDGKPLILFNRDAVQNMLLAQRFHAMHITPQIVMHCSQLHTTLKFVKQGKCGCFMFSSMLRNFPELCSIELEPEIPMKIGLVWKKGKYISPQSRAFINFCKMYVIGSN